LIFTAAVLVAIATHYPDGQDDIPVARRPATATTPLEYCSFGEGAALTLRIAVPLINNIGQGVCSINTATRPGSVFTIVSWMMQALAWILGALVVAATASAIRRTT
jgi:hypothetical protein